MGARGPKPKNPALKLLAGNPGKRPIQTGRTGRIRKGAPVRPPELTGEAAAEWDRLVSDLDAAGVLAVADRGILAAYCIAFADLLAARDAINCHGRWVEQVIQSSKGKVLGKRYVDHPALKLASDASRRIKMFGDALGLNPSARFRLEGGDSPAPASAAENKVVSIRERFQSAK